MVTIKDVSPTRSTMSFGPKWQDVSGRMLSLASADDGKLVFAGSYSSGLWVSRDGGESWEQLAWEQPPPDQFGVPGAMGGCCIPSVAVGPDSARWLVERNPRFMADVTGEGRADIVGFGDTGVWTALSNADGTFQPARVVLADFCIEAGGWHVEKHPRFLADITGANGADIIGFGDAGVFVALSNGDGTFQPPQFALADFGMESGWRVEKHLRFLADVTGNGTADIVGFGNPGVFVALSNGDGTFQPPQLVLQDLAFEAGGWRIDKHPRFLADVTGTNGADIVGFGNPGVFVALSNGDGTFQPPQLVLQDLAFEAGGWRIDKHPRFLADITGTNGADIVGFGNDGVFVALSNGDGTFQPPQFVLGDFGFEAGGWRVEKHPRFLADITGEGRADIVGFGDAGVYVTTANRDGSFAPLRFAMANFGTLRTVLAMARSDREINDSGIWRSTDDGGNWSLVHRFPRVNGNLPQIGQLVWAPGTAHLVYAAGENSLAVSGDGGATWRTATTRTGPIVVPPRPVPANHVAVAATPAGTLTPPAVYALAANMIQVSIDGGMTWTPDGGAIPRPTGGVVGLANSDNECVMVVSPRSPLEVFLTRDANSAPDEPRLWRGDYSDFAQTMASSWTELPIPNLGTQDSGNVWLAITRPGQGEALFYGQQRFFGDNIGEAAIAPLDPASASDWRQLDTTGQVHVDLHGLFLSPDFHAEFVDGRYVRRAGTVWLLSDGGIDRSTDGGITFKPAGSISSLSTVNFAGAAVPGRGPLLSLNTGDNDGFASRNGGASWRSQQYGGGDNDTSWADPLRPHSMLIFTPRWNEALALYETEPGSLPDISSSNHRQLIPGPRKVPGSLVWNASSGFVLKGYRPLVLNLPTDEPSQPPDGVFIRLFGNFKRDNPRTEFSDHLAVLFRARDLRKITEPGDWDTPGSWKVDRHPRLLADLTGTGKADSVGFGDHGVWTALSTSGGSFADPRLVLQDFGFEAGGWRVDKHPRFLADVTGTNGADIVAFGDHGVFVALSNGDGTFQPPQLVIEDFGFEAGGWRVDKHPRFVADVTGNGTADIVGFGDDGVFVALSNGDGTFQPPQFVLGDFGFEAGGWRVDKHPRFLADVTGTNGADIVGFGNDGVFVALSNGDGTFQPPQFVLGDFGFDAGGWRVDRHPRFLADVTGTNGADIVGFGNDGVFVALSNGDGTFSFTPQPVIADFGFEAGGWRVDEHVRLLADITGTNGADIVGFGNDGVFVALSNGDGTFNFTAQLALQDFGRNQDWRVEDHVRLLGDVTGGGAADIVGFGDAGVLVAPTRSDGTYRERPLFVIPNFGRNSTGPVEQVGPFLPDPTIGVVQASGGHERTVFYVGGDTGKRLWKWTDGMGSWQMVIPGRGANRAKRFYANPYDSNLLYAIDGINIVRSDDGGATWQVDESLQRMVTNDGRIPADRDEVGDASQVVLSDMQFDPFNPGRRFAVGSAGAFMTTDGATWTRLLDTGAMRGLPSNCFFDWVTAPSDPSLYVGFAGRGIVRISDLGLDGGVILHAVTPAAETESAPPDRPTTRIRTADGRLGTAEAAPDERLFITLDDGRTILVDAGDVTLVDD